MAKTRKGAGKTTHLEKIRRDIEKARKELERKGRHFTAVTDAQLRAKLRKAKSPMIVYQVWDGSAAPGGQLHYSVGISNPDPTRAIWLFVHLFVGPGNIVPDAGEALASIDERFPRLTQPAFDGLAIDPGVTARLDFVLPIPAGIEPTNYLGNSFLFGSVWHDTGQYIDRSIFVFEIV